MVEHVTADPLGLRFDVRELGGAEIVDQGLPPPRSGRIRPSTPRNPTPPPPAVKRNATPKFDATLFANSSYVAKI
jgi:hypothetical protein